MEVGVHRNEWEATATDVLGREKDGGRVEVWWQW